MDAQNSKFVPKFSQNLVFLTKNFLTRRKLSDTFLTANNLGWATVAASPPYMTPVCVPTPYLYWTQGRVGMTAGTMVPGVELCLRALSLDPTTSSSGSSADESV